MRPALDHDTGHGIATRIEVPAVGLTGGHGRATSAVMEEGAMVGPSEPRRPRVPRRPPADEGGWVSALLWVLGGVVLVVVAVVGMGAGPRQTPAPVDPDRPEAVVQTYLSAVFDGDLATARTSLSEATAQRCTPDDFQRVWVPDSLTASIDGVRSRGDDVEVQVRIRNVTGPEPFGGGGYASVETFRLTDEGAGWRLTDEPWPALGCGERS